MSVSSSTTSSEAASRPSAVAWRFVAVLAFVLSLTCGLAAAINVAIDPFGYFGFNQTGLFFDDERAFKLVQVRRYPHDALLMGDSRSAFVDPSPISTPRFFNAAFGSASFEEMAWFWEHYTGHATIVVVGMLQGDPGEVGTVGDAFANRSWRDPFRYALSFQLLQRSVEAVTRWRAGRPPNYYDNGARSIADKLITEALYQGRSSPFLLPRYVPGLIPPSKAVRNLCADRTPSLPASQSIPQGWARIDRMAELAGKRGAKLILFLQPRHQDVLAEGETDYSGPPELLVAYVCRLKLDFFDLTDSYTNPSYYWVKDHQHYVPSVGLSVLEEVLRGSGVAVKVE